MSSTPSRDSASRCESSVIGTRSSSDSSATVAGRGLAVLAAAWLLRNCSPRIRFSDSDSAGEPCSSSSKWSRSIISRSLARAARTDAERGESVSSASSPSASPRPSSRTTTSVAPATTSRRPARTRYIASPGSPSRNSHSPAARRSGRKRSASCSSSRGSSSANSGDAGEELRRLLRRRRSLGGHAVHPHRPSGVAAVGAPAARSRAGAAPSARPPPARAPR